MFGIYSVLISAVISFFFFFSEQQHVSEDCSESSISAVKAHKIVSLLGLRLLLSLFYTAGIAANRTQIITCFILLVFTENHRVYSFRHSK